MIAEATPVPATRAVPAEIVSGAMTTGGFNSFATTGFERSETPAESSCVAVKLKPIPASRLGISIGQVPSMPTVTEGATKVPLR
jgi:hypothetical protein